MTVNKYIYSLYGGVREFLRDRRSKLTWWTVFSLIAFGIPNLFGYATFYSGMPHWFHVAWGWLQTASGKWLFIVVAFVVIWLDQRRITKKLHGKKPHDVKTLRGRTLKLRDDLKQFVESVGPRPDVEPAFGQSNQEFIKANWAVVMPWMDKLKYGYELRFSEAVNRIHYQYGELSLLPGIGVDLPAMINSEKEVLSIIEKLNVWRKKPQIKRP